MNPTFAVTALAVSTVPIVALALLLKYMIGKIDEEYVAFIGFFVGLAAVLSPVITAGMIIDAWSN